MLDRALRFKYLWTIALLSIVVGLKFTTSNSSSPLEVERKYSEPANKLSGSQNDGYGSAQALEITGSDVDHNPFKVAVPNNVNYNVKTSISPPHAEVIPPGESASGTSLFEEWLNVAAGDRAVRHSENATQKYDDVTDNSQTSISESSTNKSSRGTGQAAIESLSLSLETVENIDFSITGYVVNTYGKPIPNAEITATPSASKSISSRTQSLPNGSFTLTGLLPGSYELNVDGGDTYTKLKQLQHAGERGARLVLHDSTIRTIEGTVTDMYGTPIDGAIVSGSLGRSRTVTQANGNFSLDVPSSNSGALIRYLADGFLDTSRHIFGEEWENTTSIDGSVVMQERGSLIINGSITDDSNIPVKDAYVEVRSRNPSFRLSTKTDEQGLYTIPNVPISNSADIQVKSGNRYEVHSLNGVKLLHDSVLDFSLQSRQVITLSTKLIGSGGTLVSNMPFHVSNVSNRGTTIYSVSDDTGYLEVKNVNPGTFRLRSLVTSPVVQIDGLQADTLHEIPVDIGPYSLSGRLLFSDGTPASNADLSMVYETNSHGITSKTSRFTRSDSSGAFDFGGLGAGEREITVASESAAPFTVRVDPTAQSSEVFVIR